MRPETEDINRILELLAQAPILLETATRGLQSTRLNFRSEEEPWSVSDILAHLRACSDVWGTSIIAMITKDNPSIRYVSPRSWMKKPKYADQKFVAALESFTEEREKLVKILAELDDSNWERPYTFTKTSARQRNQTVFSYAERIVNHELHHLEQIESLLR